MVSSLLTTKLQIPPTPYHILGRPHLIETLEQKILHYKLTVISAPAGYGKTTLLAQWAHTTELSTVWLSIDNRDSDLESLLRYLFTGWRQFQPAINESKLGLLLSGTSPDGEAVLSAFINVAAERAEHLVFVIDDYHYIQESAIHKALTFLIDHLPATLHFVLISRENPPLPLARYRARQELFELETQDLKFQPRETEHLLNQRTDIQLPHDTILALHEQLEGWVAGLQLAILALGRDSRAIDDWVRQGTHRFMADYFNEDILRALPESTQQFLLQTSILEYLSGSLCNAVTARNDSQAMLEQLERENIFLVRLDSHREWFRYHQLFAEFLATELARRYPSEVTTLHQRAARWYLAHDLSDQAFEHAVSGNDTELVLEIANRYIPSKLLGGEVRIVQDWLDSLPEAWYLSQPALGLFQACLLLVKGQFDNFAHHLDIVELQTRKLAINENWVMPRVNALRCFIACYKNNLAEAEILSDQALQDLPQDDMGFRPGIYGALGDTYRRNGLWQEAQQAYLQLLDYTHTSVFRVQAVHTYGALADLHLKQGHLSQAEKFWREALASIQNSERWGIYPLPLIGWVYIRLAEILYEKNAHQKAWEYLLQGLDYAELGGDVRALIAGYLSAGRLSLTAGDIEGAVDYLERARPYVETTQFLYWNSRFERFQLELWLAQDKLRTAVEWADTALNNDSMSALSERESARLALGRVLIAKGDSSSIEQALTIIEQIQQVALAEGRSGHVIECYAFQALAWWQLGDYAKALIALEKALRLAEPENYVRLFVDLGLPMARLLQEARARDVMPRYVEQLLETYDIDFDVPHAEQAVLVEPLTTREDEILNLIAAGLTNREIADQLVISPETVKKHAGNIYGKLGVSNRTEAATKARELDLLH